MSKQAVDATALVFQRVECCYVTCALASFLVCDEATLCAPACGGFLGLNESVGSMFIEQRVEQKIHPNGHMPCESLDKARRVKYANS
jgi:hypothetical protein